MGKEWQIAEEETLHSLERRWNIHKKTIKQTVEIENLVFAVSSSTILKRENQKYLYKKIISY